MLKRVLSGGQTGADIMGIAAAKCFEGLEYGGTMPNGFLTTDGYKPEWAALYNMVEHKSKSYVPRTWHNAKESDGTIRLAFNFGSPGEIVTLNAITKYNRPYIDVDLKNPRPHQEVVDWILQNNIEVLNIAGNAEKTHKGTGALVFEYMKEVYRLLGFMEKAV